MSLASGTWLGPYEITALLGAGGMGEVYRARDPKLGRDVALKILPEEFARDPERLARFEREARMLASLNHPHIAHIHGFEESSGRCALVMELVEGEDLAQRLARGPIPVDEALPMARQVVEALETAHEQGIIHRDLKPANIKVRADGTVKVLDFGLAKALDPARASTTDATRSPTISMHATEAGIILGTAAYMAPEQARGRVVDKRADIWAFGCVLFEMLTGTRAFNADDVTDTIVAVVSKEPNWQTLPAAASGVRPLIARCLKKDPKQRLQAIGDARIQIDELMSGTAEEVATTRAPVARLSRGVAAVAIAALVGGALISALATWALTRPAPKAPTLPSRFSIVPPRAQALTIQGADRDIAISPDGRHIVYRAGPLAQLVVRAIDRLDPQPLTGITNARAPFFSFDSQWIGFFDGATLKKVPIGGGSVITICENLLPPRGASWGDDNNIVFANRDATTGLLRVPAAGGEPTVLTKPDATKGEEFHWYPSLLPERRGVLFTMARSNQPELAYVAVLDSKSGQHKRLVRGSQAEYLSTGHLLYMASGVLTAVRFDLDRLEVLSDPAPLVDDVWTGSSGAAGYAVSRLGTLVYVPGAGARTPRSLVWVDRNGQATPIPAPPRAYEDLRLSPDATRIALGIRDQENDIWIWNLAGGQLTRLTFGAGFDRSPVWTEDSQRIVFASVRDGAAGLFSQATDGSGTAERLTTGGSAPFPTFVAPDGTGVLGSDISPTTAGDIVWFALARPGRGSGSAPVPAPPRQVLSQSDPRFIESHPEIAPNGRYLAYQSNESGRSEIYVRPFPRVNDGRWQVSTNGGTKPVWARNGRELFYLDAENALTAVPVQTSTTAFAAGHPRKMFATTYAWLLSYNAHPYDVSPDNQRFLMIQETATDRNVAPGGMVVVLNWFEELKAKLPAGR